MREQMKKIDKKVEEQRTIAAVTTERETKRRKKNKYKEWKGVTAYIMIAGKRVRTLVDMGAFELVIGKKCVQRLGLEERIVQQQTSFKGVEGLKMEIEGWIDLEVVLNDKKVVWRVWVAEHVVVPMIIGINVLNDTMVNLKE